MARTQAGAQLTLQHKTAQLAVQASALRAFLQLWTLWRGDDRTFRLLADATVPLVREQHRASATLAGSYFDAFRFAERAHRSARTVVPDPPDAGRIAGTLYTVGRDMARDAIDAGQSPQAAMRSALVRSSGTVGRLTLEGGRLAVVRSTVDDPDAVGWARYASANCCAFCAMLAGRGAVYEDETVTFRAHDHCVCMFEPAYRDSAPPPNSARYREIYDATAKGRPDALQVFRRALADERVASAA